MKKTKGDIREHFKNAKTIECAQSFGVESDILTDFTLDNIISANRSYYVKGPTGRCVYLYYSVEDKFADILEYKEPHIQRIGRIDRKDSAAKESFYKQTNPETSEYECFFHYEDIDPYSAGFQDGIKYGALLSITSESDTQDKNIDYLNTLRDMATGFPNDQELGRELRKLLN